MINVQISAETFEELWKQLEVFRVPATGAVETPKKSKATHAEPKAETQKAEPAKAEVTNPAPSGANGKAEEVGTYIAKIAKVKGKAAAIELLGKFGAKRGQDVKAEDQVKFVAEAKTLVGE